jgi:hypothetical protein
MDAFAHVIVLARARFLPSSTRPEDRIDMATPRVTHPIRNQSEICFALPEDALAAEHPARAVVGLLPDGSVCVLTEACAFEGGSGRATTSPRMLLTLWTYAISRGVGARVRSSERS